MLTLKALKRDTKIKPKMLRKEGKLPAVFYGRKEVSTPISVSQSDFIKVLREAGESSVVALLYPEKELNVLIHDVAYDPVRDEPIHVDFYVVEADKPVEVGVALEFIGVAPAEKELGGTVVKVLHELQIEGLPKDLPQNLEVDVSSLETLESQITAKDISLPQGITLITSPDEVVAAVSVAKEEEEEKPEEEFDASQVEVEAKGKKEEEGGTDSKEERKDTEESKKE